MQNQEAWKYSKYEPAGDGWRASRDPTEVLAGSRLITDLVCAEYVAAIRKHANGRLMDLGCGKAPLYGVYREYSAEVTCVDWPGSAHGTSHVDQFVDLNGPMPFENDRFDTIICTDVLEHIWRHDVLWPEVARILAPGGKAIIGTPFMYWLHEEPHDYFRWTPHALKAGARDSGLETVEMRQIGGAIDVVADILGKIGGSRLGGVVPAVLQALARTSPVRRRSGKWPGFALAHLTVVAKSR